MDTLEKTKYGQNALGEVEDTKFLIHCSFVQHSQENKALGTKVEPW